MKWVVTACVIFATAFAASGQVLQGDFLISAEACLNENIKLTNESAGAHRFEWDLCQGDLSLPAAGFISSTLGGSVTTGIDVVFDGTSWFGFVTSQNTNSIFRLDFGADINSDPEVVDLGNIDGNLNSPTDIKIVWDNGNWYGFVYGLSDPLISRVNFGDQLNNMPDSPSPVTADVVMAGAGSINGGFDMIHDGSQWIIVMTYNSTFNIVRLAEINSVPAAPDIISGIPNPHGLSLGDIALGTMNGEFFAYVVAFGNRTLQRLTFGTTLFAEPQIDNIPVTLLADFSPYGVDLDFDNGNYYLLVSTLEGTFVNINLGSDLNGTNISANALPFPQFENTLKVKLIKHESSWMAFSTSWNTTRLFRLDFPNADCETNHLDILSEASPVITYSLPGPKVITLRAFNESGQFSETSQSIEVTTDAAPEVAIGFEGFMC